MFEEVGIDLEQIQRRRVWHPRRFHEAEEQEEIVQLGRLLAKVPLVADQRGATEDFREARSQQGQAQRPTSTFTRTAVPPRLSSPKSLEMPAVPRTPVTCVYCTSMLTPTQRC